MSVPCIAFNPCLKCNEKGKCNICELTYYRNGYIKSPTADVVEVVRCKDCKYYKPQTRSITWNNTTKYCCRGANVKVNEDDYCSYGERREE